MNKVVSRFQISNSLVETVQDVMNNNSKLKSFDERNNTVNLYENRLPINLAINHSDKIAREHARKWAYHNKEMTSLVNNRKPAQDGTWPQAEEYAKHAEQAIWHWEQYNARLDQLEAKKTTVNESFAGGLVGAGIGAGVGLGMSALGADPSIAIPGYSIPGYFLGAYNPWSRNVSYDEHHTKSKEEHDLLRDRLINRGWKIYDQSSMANSSWRVQDYYNRNNASGNQVPTIASIKNDPLHKTTLLFKGSNIATGRSVALKAIKYPKDSINEKITSDMSVQDIIRDFVHSNDKRFRGKTKKQRIQMALGAYYNMHPSEKKNNLEESSELLPKIKKLLNTVTWGSGAAALTSIADMSPLAVVGSGLIGAGYGYLKKVPEEQFSVGTIVNYPDPSNNNILKVGRVVKHYDYHDATMKAQKMKPIKMTHIQPINKNEPPVHVKTDILNSLN